MIYLNKDSQNDVVLELSLNCSLASPYFLFEVIKDINPSEVVYFTATDLSSYQNRYNQFSLTLTGSAYTNLSAGTLDLKTGSYTVNIYEASASTLSLSATTGEVISTGSSLKLIVSGEDTELSEVYR